MMDKPNILILMPDQLRADCMSCAGHPNIKTPNMDRLAVEGMRFTQAATVSPICMPARASFASGLYPHNHGMWTNSGEMPADDETFFQLLQRAGYYTAHIGKADYYPHWSVNHLREREWYMHARGLEYVHEVKGPHASCDSSSYMTDYWESKNLWEIYQQDYRERDEAGDGMVRPSPLPVEDFLDSYVGRQAVNFIRNYQETRPLCLFVGFGGPHEPWDAPGEYALIYNPAKMPSPIPVTKRSRHLPDWINDKEDFRVWPPEALANIPKIQANYYGKISLIDDWVGKILEAYSNRGWLDDLLVVFWSDHGEMLGDHGRFYKSTFFESVVKVPLILRWPGRISVNTVSSSLAEITDVFPTLLEAVKCPSSHRCLGRSLWPVIHSPEAKIHDFQLSEIYEEGHHIMIRSRTRKYVVDGEARGFMLYDLENDPYEHNNLIGSENGSRLEGEMREVLMKRIIEAQYCQ